MGSINELIHEKRLLYRGVEWYNDDATIWNTEGKSENVVMLSFQVSGKVVRMINIRVMSIADYDGVYSLWINTPGMGLNSTDDSKEGIEKYLKRNPTSSFVAESDGKIVGVIMAGHDGRRGYIHHTAVLPEYRNRGIATSLVDHAMAALDMEGINKVALVAFKKNDIGNGFWQNIGFTDRDDLVYRNKNIHVLHRIDT